MPAVTEEEIDDTFYKSYGEGTPAGLNAGLADAAAPKGRRKLLGNKEPPSFASWRTAHIARNGISIVRDRSWQRPTSLT
jgi:hypothetical protein